MGNPAYYFILGRDADRWWHRWYLLDWAFVVGLLIVVGIISKTAHPFNRYLPPDDPSVAFPFQNDIIPDWLLVFLSVIIPFIFLLAAQLIIRSKHDFHHAVLTLGVTITLGLIVTVPLKYLAGRYRPDYDARIALNPNDEDARLSFPSGHSSMSFSSLVYISLYIAGKLKVFSNHSGSVFGRSVLSMLPLIICIFISVSRTMDYHHNFSDILGGALIGFGVAFVSYFLYYPSLFDKNSHVPKSYRDGKDAEIPHEQLPQSDFSPA